MATLVCQIIHKPKDHLTKFMPRAGNTSTATTRPRTSDAIDPAEIEWKLIDNAQIPFPRISTGIDEERDVLELTVTGTVVTSFLRTGQYGHTLQIKLLPADRRRLQSFVQTVPDFDEKYRSTFKWPWSEDNKNPGHVTAKFISKEYPDEEFKVVWDGRDLVNLADIEARKPISYTNIRNGSLIYVEFTVAVWKYTEAETSDREGGKKKGKVSTGCTFKLLSVGLINDGYIGYNINSPMKKRRMAY
jgi:hypothetical protein